MGAELIDDGGNRYGMHEIRAIFYNWRLIRDLQAKVAALEPSKERVPIQLNFPFMRELPLKGNITS